MPGETIVQGAQPVEYVEEATFGQPETETAWNWFGLVTSHDVTQEVEAETVTYLPPTGVANKLEQKKNVKVSEAYSGDLTYHPQGGFNVLQLFTGADGTTSSEIPSWQIGEQNEEQGEYRRILGVVGEDWELSVSEDSIAEVSTSWMAADAEDWSTTDYTGAGGTHATENTAEPLTYDDLTSVQLGGAELNDAVEELTLSISNDLEVVKDFNSDFGTHVHAIEITDREVTVELTLTYADFNLAQTVRSYTPQDLTFTFGGYNFTVPDVQFPEFPYEMSPEDLVGDSVGSDPATGVTWAAV